MRKKDVDVLKHKTIRDYEYFVRRLQKGYKELYSHILNQICFIEINSFLDNKKAIYEYLIQ